MVAVLALTALTMTACAKAPAEDISAADAAIAAAETAEAGEYAPAALGSVKDLRAQLDTELSVQNEKFALTRSYDRAKELAVQIKTAADQATTEAATAKEAVRVETATLIDEVKAALTEAQGMLAAAPRGKGSALDLAVMATDLDSAAVALGEGETAFGEGHYMVAKTKVTAARDGIGQVKSAIEAAQAARRGR